MNSRTIFGPLGVSIACIAVCLIALLVQAPPIFAALVQPKVQASDTSSKIDTLVQKHEKEAELLEERFNGRSAFFEPDKPLPRITRTPAQTQRREAPDPIEREAPATYGGSLKPLWSVEQNEVIVADGGREIEMSVGDARGGVKLISVNAPYSVTVEWTKQREGHISYKTGTYSIPFREGLFDGASPALLSTAPAPGTRRLEGGPGNISSSGRDDPRRNRLNDLRNRGRSFDDDDDDEDSED